MRLIRNIQRNKLSRFFIPALAVLFVFSLSFHNHAFGEHDTHGLDSHPSASHSIEDCSACLLQGNLQAPKIEYSFNNNNLSQSIIYISIDFIVPHSFLNLDKPSRAPPSV